jgi:metal-responsive CopG/Arc/MetJ family transcriptional regulator
VPKRKKTTVTLTEELLKRLQDYRRAQPIIPSRSEAIAKLLDKALKTEGF